MSLVTGTVAAHRRCQTLVVCTVVAVRHPLGLPTGAHVDVTAQSELVKVEMVELGDEYLDQAETISAVRIDVSVHPAAMLEAGLGEVGDEAENEPDADGYVSLQDCSACTQIPASTPHGQLGRIAAAMVAFADDRLRAGHRPDRIVESLSWADATADDVAALRRQIPTPL